MIKVKVTGAPGFEDFEGWTTPDIHELTHPDGDLRSVVTDSSGTYVFKSQYVTEVK